MARSTSLDALITKLVTKNIAVDFGVTMHLTWPRRLLENREFVLVEGRHPSSGPSRGQDNAGYDSEEEEHGLYHQGMHPGT